MKTTAEDREFMRKVAKLRVGTAETVCWDSVQMLSVLDDFAALEAELDNAEQAVVTAAARDYPINSGAAELAALRRVDSEHLEVECNHARIVARRWRIIDEDRLFGFGSTLAEALADYDAKKAQDEKGRMP